MHLYNPTNKEIESLRWAKFLEAAKTKFWALTLDQYRDLLLRKTISCTTDLQMRVDTLFATKPVIGITTDGKIVIRTFGTFNTDELDMSFTWIPAWYIGTVTNTDVKVTTVDINFDVTTDIVRHTIKNLLSITTDDLTSVPVMNFTHNLIGLTKGGFTYCDGVINTTPVPDGAKWIAGLTMLKSRGTNSMKVIDDKGLEHDGQWDLNEGTLIYDAITVTETVPTTPSTSI